ncbi:MAG: PIN domain nuclease [Candidatus Marinimicrobia bacterium]|nr:PIN domain nuclease [Candidatus Neomarinimicrobiota bacterium]MBL7010192.1 PIN domain nuclease [Candidatus Neomarinimicrobiota bacterium]MBL7030605.1 PIN domain nuclease [Candidatus Neomarinimicrobiota bacterium]
MILVDSSVWVDYFNGIISRETDLLDEKISTTPILIGDLILIEVLQGFKKDKDYKKAKGLFSQFIHVELGGFEIANKSADNYRKLRKKGVTIRKTIDMIIASYCIENNVTLLHADKDFQPMEKLLGLITI